MKNLYQQSVKKIISFVMFSCALFSVFTFSKQTGLSFLTIHCSPQILFQLEDSFHLKWHFKKRDAVSRPNSKTIFHSQMFKKNSGLIRLTLPVILKCTGCLFLPHKKEHDFTSKHQLLLSASHLSLESCVALGAATQKTDLPVLAHSGMGIYCRPLLNYPRPKGTPFGSLGEAAWATSTPSSFYSEFLGPDGIYLVLKTVCLFFISTNLK